MKIAIIGGSGFVGTSLINKLKEDNNYQVKNLDIAQSKKHHEITSITDIRDYCSLTKSLAGCDCVVLLAAQHRDDVSPRILVLRHECKRNGKCAKGNGR